MQPPFEMHLFFPSEWVIKKKKNLKRSIDLFSRLLLNLT